MTLNCTVTSMERTEQYTGVEKITFPAYRGEMQVLPGHAEMFLVLGKGNMTMHHSDGHEDTRQISSGECHIKDDNVVVVL
jgi:F0F1-type ATP synthase epsilon subunit